ncbi:transcriptional coactivator/pterin dehydratase [Durotheca rogersii]|uniref:transcriptional coactivator/pterin dehydratase n=1 Tax=Durotheca rogersii TaxID=419775 RepID=UPI00221F6593|nr:transcriptional coactivator/pterin dehydratase [Durotheca rogersii]KAI5866931.1 transcriptional coactivator/pterin dehydratase [Durotheca rogersii]
MHTRVVRRATTAAVAAASAAEATATAATRRAAAFWASRKAPSRQTPGRRTLASSAAPAMAPTPSTAPQVRFSANADEPALRRALEPLLASAGRGGRWVLTPGGEGLERSFRFKTFAKTWDFMTAVSLQCKLKNHHPEWSNVYNVAHIRWTTHEPRGLSALDVALAAACDGLAADFGEVAGPADEAGASLQQATDRAAAAAGGECCVPRRK